MQFLATVVQGPHHSIFGAYAVPPFRFQPRNRSMDWRRMSVLDVDRVTRELDVATLQENLTDITFCTLDWEDCSHCSQPSGQALLNVLRLAQLSIEYLMHCQDFLVTRVTLLELHLQASLSQQSCSQQELDCQAEELRALREERRQQRKMIKDLQQLLQWSGGQSYYMCHLCEKMFLSASYLQSHLQHRHEGTAQGGKQNHEESMEEVVRDLRAQLTPTQEELSALLKKQQQLQEAKTTCQRKRDAKAMFEEWGKELSEEIDQQKQAFWDELKSSVLPNSPLEEKPGSLQSCSAMGSSLGSLQDAECEELLSQVQEYEDLRILKDTKIQLQDENQELRRKNNELQEEKEKMQKDNEKLQRESEKFQELNETLQEEKEKLHTENEKLQKLQDKNQELQRENKMLQDEKEKMQKENEKLQRESEKFQELNETLQEENEKLQRESEKFQELNETLQEENEKLHNENEKLQKTQTSWSRKVKGSSKGLKAVNMDKHSSIEEPEDSQDEQHKVLEAQGQNISLLKLFGQTLGNDRQERQESKGTKRDAEEVPTRTFRHFMKQRGEKKEGKFSEWCSRASERAARWFSGSRKRARQCW